MTSVDYLAGFDAAYSPFRDVQQTGHFALAVDALAAKLPELLRPSPALLFISRTGLHVAVLLPRLCSIGRFKSNKISDLRRTCASHALATLCAANRKEISSETGLFADIRTS